MKEKIIQIFEDLKINRVNTGYFLWLELIERIYMDYSLKQLPRVKIGECYEYLSTTFDKTLSSVEKCLRYLIEEKHEEIRQYFRYYDNKITNKSFLILVVEKLNER